MTWNTTSFYQNSSHNNIETVSAGTDPMKILNDNEKTFSDTERLLSPVFDRGRYIVNSARTSKCNTRGHLPELPAVLKIRVIQWQ
jgi:tRNA(Glu) U13 pseudouridine synthase TruD